MEISIKISFVAVLLFIIAPGICQTALQNKTLTAKDYRFVFGSNWGKAENFVAGNQTWMLREAKSERVDYQTAIPVVFPELIRYSAIRDKMEITLLKALYKHYGPDYANFSVGVFQIKPSCAEEMLREISKTGDRKFVARFSALNDSLTEKEKRATIINELENPVSEFNYVLGIIKILDKRFRRIRFSDELEKLCFYATAYNCGFSNTEDYIRKQMKARSFHTGLIRSGDLYSYADVSMAYFRESSGEKAPVELTKLR